MHFRLANGILHTPKPNREQKMMYSPTIVSVTKISAPNQINQMVDMENRLIFPLHAGLLNFFLLALSDAFEFVTSILGTKMHYFFFNLLLSLMCTFSALFLCGCCLCMRLLFRTFAPSRINHHKLYQITQHTHSSIENENEVGERHTKTNGRRRSSSRRSRHRDEKSMSWLYCSMFK